MCLSVDVVELDDTLVCPVFVSDGYVWCAITHRRIPMETPVTMIKITNMGPEIPSLVQG
jgi:hypothetical protein